MLAEVLKDLKGTAVFQTDEEWLQFDIVMGRTGTATVSGEMSASTAGAGLASSSRLRRTSPILRKC